jgi:cytoskeleton protein RodZ
MGVPAPAGAGIAVGSLLREARERRGQDLSFVANALRIRQPYLQAIEDGRSEDLPGSTYAVGFVRGYAEFLGLDSKEIVRRFRQENGEFSNRAELVFPSAVSEGSIPTGALLGLALVAAAIAYGAWYWYQSRESSEASAVPALPERLAALIHQPVGNGSELVPVDANKVNEVRQPPVAATAPSAAPSSAAPPSAPSAGSPPPSGSTALVPHEDIVPPSEDDGSVPPAPSSPAVAADAGPSAASTPSNDDAAQSGDNRGDGKPVRDAKGKVKGKGKSKDAAAEAAKPVASPTETPSVASIGDARPTETSVDRTPGEPTAATSGRVVLRAKEDCWIEIRDSNGKVVQKRLLRKGETFSTPTRPGLSMTVGNAGALSVVVDGKATGTLGRIGMVRHDVPLDAERLRDDVEAPADTPAGQPAGSTAGSAPGPQ